MKKELKSKFISDKWLMPYFDKAKKLSNCGHDIFERKLVGGVTAYALKGISEPHTDKDFPKWSYIIVIRADESPVLTCRGHKDLELKPGMIIQFNSHVMHEVKQVKSSVLVWLALDSEQELSLYDAAEYHRIRCKRYNKEPKSVVST